MFALAKIAVPAYRNVEKFKEFLFNTEECMTFEFNFFGCGQLSGSINR